MGSTQLFNWLSEVDAVGSSKVINQQVIGRNGRHVGNCWQCISSANILELSRIGADPMITKGFVDSIGESSKKKIKKPDRRAQEWEYENIFRQAKSVCGSSTKLTLLFPHAVMSYKAHKDLHPPCLTCACHFVHSDS